MRLLFPGALAKHAVSEGTKAVAKYASKDGSTNAPATRSQRAGLCFPVGRISRMLRTTGLRIGAGSAVYLAAVLEYFTAEALELSGNDAVKNHRIRITPRNILIAIRSDNELDKLLSDVTIPDGGVIPTIDGVLQIPSKNDEHTSKNQEVSDLTFNFADVAIAPESSAGLSSAQGDDDDDGEHIPTEDEDDDDDSDSDSEENDE